MRRNPPSPGPTSKDRTPPSPKPPSRGALVVVAATILGCIGLGVWVFRSLRAVRDATAQVRKLGGTVTTVEDEKALLGPVSLAGRPITDLDLAALRPAFLAARGPKELDLSRTKVTDAGLRELEGLTFMETLRLDDTGVTGTGLVHLAKMGSEGEGSTVLSLARTRVDDESLARLGQVSALGELDLSGTKVAGPGLRHLQSLKRLQDVRLEGCPIDDAGLEGVDGWTTVSGLSLAGTRVSDAGLPRVRRLEQLQSLSLQGTAITDAGLATLEGWDSLTSLSLADTAVTDAGILRLKGRGNLMSLDLSGTAVTDDALGRMAGWPTLHTLALERTGITDAGLMRLADLPRLDRILLRDSRCTEGGLDALRRLKPQLTADR